MSNYRVLVSYDPERSVFVARAPELPHCSADGATRAEALTKVEEEIDAQLRNMRESGGRPPVALDDDSNGLSGEIAAKVSRTLHRDLVWQARSEGVELGQLVAEMLAGGLDARRARGGRRPSSAQPTAGNPGNEREVEGQQPRRDDRGPGPGGGDRRPFRGNDRGGGGGRYHAIMEDRATFLEYVRGLESGGGGPPRGDRGGPPRGRRGGGGGGGGGGGRRVEGGGGPAGGGDPGNKDEGDGSK